MQSTGFLTDIERAELRAVLRRVRGEALALRRANMLLLLDKGWTYAQVAEAFFLDETTILAVHRGYTARGMASLAAKDIPGAPNKLSDAQRKAVIEHLDTVHYATSQEIRDYIVREYGITYSHAGIISFLKALGFVHQETRLVAPVPDMAKQQEAIAAYKALKEALPADEVIVHVDGVHPTHMAKTGKIWVKKGEKLHIPSNTGRNRIHIHGAINLADGRFTFMNNLTIDAKSTIQLFQKLENVYSDKRKIHVYLDNARYHYSKDVQEWLQKGSNRIVLHFLPAYCPHLNPIERLWHILHKNVTRNAYYPTFNAFSDAILRFCRQTIPKDWERIKSYVTDTFAPKSTQNLRFI